MAYRDYDRDREFREQGYSSREEAEADREEVGREEKAPAPEPADRSHRGPDFSERDFGTDHPRPPRRDELGGIDAGE